MPKAYSDLFPAITSFANLHLAFKKAARGKRGQPQPAGFEMGLEGNLFRLQDELRSSTYRPGGYYSFHIRDPKHRLVSHSRQQHRAGPLPPPRSLRGRVGEGVVARKYA